MSDGSDNTQGLNVQHAVRLRGWELVIDDVFIAGGQVRASLSATSPDGAVVRTRMSLTSGRDRRRFMRLLVEAAGDSSGIPDEVALLGAEDALRARMLAALGAAAEEIEGVLPWPRQVHGRLLIREIADLFERHLFLPPGAALALACYVVYTWCAELFDVAPILALISPTRRSGKTTTLEILASLVFRAIPLAHVSMAALFRVVDESHGTLVIDEADTFLKVGRSDSLVGLINAGHRRQTAKAVRTVPGPDGPEPRSFSVFGPKIVAAIRELPPTLQDRSIQILMMRRGRNDEIVPLRYDDLEHNSLRLKSKIVRWLIDNIEALEEADPESPLALHDRLRESWRPLLAVAQVAGESVLQSVLDAALLLYGAAKTDEPDRGIELLRDIYEIAKVSASEFITTEALLSLLRALPEARWKRDVSGKPLDARALASLLKPFGIEPEQPSRGAKRGYWKRQLLALCERYVAVGTENDNEASEASASSGLDEMAGPDDPTP